MAGTFQKTYSILNPAQKKAVDAIEGPVMVVAGPGTGKTQVLAARIANILLKTDAKPHNILALTFTDAAAKNMRERVVKMIGKEGYYVQIMTFHSFCQGVLSNNPEYFPIDRNSQALSELEKYELFESIVNDLKLEVLKPINAPLFYVRELISRISNLKREGFSVDEYRQIVEREFDELLMEDMKKTEAARFKKNGDKNRELVQVYSEYEKRIRAQSRYDFDDMVMLVKQAFSEHEILLRDYQEQLLYFLVDEYQDTNSSQNAVLELLASFWGSQANVFVVGDPHQSIYRFQGASLENVFSFMDLYPDAEVVTLETGYRCPQEIYDAAHSVISNNDMTNPDSVDETSQRHMVLEAVSQRLVSAFNETTHNTAISTSVAPSQVLEHIMVAEKIKRLLDSGTQAEEIAILYRRNSEVVEIEHVLDKWGITYQLDAGQNILRDESIHQLLQFFQLLMAFPDATENELIYEVLCYDWMGIDSLSVMKVTRAAQSLKKSIFETVYSDLDEINDKISVTPLTQKQHQALQSKMEQLQLWSLSSNSKLLTEWFENVLDESGYLEYVLSHDDHLQMITNVNTLFSEVKQLVDSQPGFSLPQLMQTIELMIKQNISILAEDLHVSDGAVTLTTVHKAKGREWQHVFLVHCVDKMWGNGVNRDLLPLPEGLLKNSDISKKEQNEDDRRLFYVAISRAKETVHISSSQTSVEGISAKSMIPSMFIAEMEGGAEDENDFVELRTKVDTLLLPSSRANTSPSEESFFAGLVKDYKLSVTGLNKYLADPYGFKNDVLLRVPKAKAEHMVFGTAIHAALESLYAPLVKDQEPLSIPKVLDVYESSLRNEAMVVDDYERRLRYGKELIQKYADNLDFSSFDVQSVEQFVGSGMHTAVLDDIYIAGRLDRIDWIDRAKKIVRVVDYKTGQQRTKNTIEAKTKTALKNLSEREQLLPESVRGPYKRQLLFYKLLVELDRNLPFEVVEGTFDFVEPHKQSGKFAQHTFKLPDEDVSDLKELIRIVMKEIRGLEFLNAQPLE